MRFLSKSNTIQNEKTFFFIFIVEMQPKFGVANVHFSNETTNFSPIFLITHTKNTGIFDKDVKDEKDYFLNTDLLIDYVELKVPKNTKNAKTLLRRKENHKNLG